MIACPIRETLMILRRCLFLADFTDTGKMFHRTGICFVLVGAFQLVVSGPSNDRSGLETANRQPHSRRGRPHPPRNLADRHPGRLQSHHITHVAHRKPLRRHPGSHPGTVGEIIPKWWATSSGMLEASSWSRVTDVAASSTRDQLGAGLNEAASGEHTLWARSYRARALAEQ
jgi:hypothetical protein